MNEISVGCAGAAAISVTFAFAAFIGAARAQGPWDIDTNLPASERAAFAAQLLEEGGAGGFIPGTKSTGENTSSAPFYDVPEGEWTPRFGREVRTLEVFDAASGQYVTKNWLQLSRDQFLAELNNQYSETVLFRKSKDGSFNFVGAVTAGMSGKKGEYRIVHNNFRFKTYNCSDEDPSAGQIAVGVGLRIMVDAVSKSGGFNFGFGPLALAANRQDLQGVIRAEVRGLANSVTLSTISADLAGDAVTFDNLIKASNLDAVAGQALESISGPTTPTLIAYKDGKLKGSCFAAMQAEATRADLGGED